MGTPISALSSDTPATGDQIPVNKSGTTKKITVGGIADLALGQLSATSPLVYSAKNFSIPAADSGTNGYLSQVDWGTFNNKQSSITGSNSYLVWKNDSGTVESITGWGIDSTHSGASWNLPVDVTDASGGLHIWNAQFDPSEAGTTNSWTFISSLLEIDTGSDGFGFATNAQALTYLGPTIKHHGTSDVGGLAIMSGNFDIGNGVDAIDVKGFAYSYGFGSVADNVTLVGPIQGYGIQPNLSAGVVCDTSNAYYSGFYDAANVEGTWNGSWTSFSSNPNIDTLDNTKNIVGFQFNPTVDNIGNNCGINGANIGGTFGTFGTSSYWNGVIVNPTITAGQNVTLLGLYDDNVTASGFVKAMDVRGDCSITGDFQLTGAFNYNGPLNLFASQALSEVASTFNFISNPTVAASATLTNADYLGVNTASLIQIGAGASVSTFLTGISALGLPAVVTVGAGATVDRIAGATFALSLDATAPSGGTIENVMCGQALSIPNGVTTVDNYYGWFADLPFGDVGTNRWGVYIKPASMQNWLAGSLKIGGTAGSTDQTTNSSIELELTSKALRLANMDTSARDALTALPGMVIYNTDTNAMQYYNGTIWV